MLEENSTQPPKERLLRKLNVTHGEPNMPEILNKEPSKLASSDKSNKSWPPSWKVLPHTSREELTDEVQNSNYKYQITIYFYIFFFRFRVFFNYSNKLFFFLDVLECRYVYNWDCLLDLWFFFF